MKVELHELVAQEINENRLSFDKGMRVVINEGIYDNT